MAEVTVIKMPIYYKCNMKPHEHLLAYIIFSVIASVVVYLFYHLLFISVVMGFLLGIYLERMYADSTVHKRQHNLRLQFRTFLESMSVATRAGSSPTQAIDSAYDDLKVSYRPDADIIIEVENIIRQYKQGGVPLPVLLRDLADRSDLEDVASFASIYEVIDGKSNRIGDILSETSEIIGDKIEIEQEIETTIQSAKSETNMMLIMPIIMVVMMSAMGGDLMSSLFETWSGHLAATAALVLFVISYIMSSKISNINV